MEIPHSLMVRDTEAPIFMVAPNDPPFVTPSMTVNLVMRVFLGIVANLACLVPLRLLYRNGEFSAVVFIVVVEVKNIFTIVMALIWRTDNMESWWPGYGLCDIQQFVYNGCAGIFVTCLLAIMRNLAHQVGMLRANPLTVKEKRRRNLIQALIIFPLPIVQLAFTWPLAEQRYAVGSIMGCNWVPSSTWPYLLFYVIAELVISVVAGIYAVITFFRFRQVSKLTSSALTSNRVALLRSQRAKRRLYLMVMSILVPFLPITVTLCVLNVRALGPLEPFDFNKIHRSSDSPVPWAAVIFMPSRVIDFGMYNNGYISILTAIPIFLFFGMTKEAMNSYRSILLFLGLGRIWPDLHNEYDPDRKALQSAASAGYMTRTTGKTKSSFSSRYKLATQVTARSTSSNNSTTGSTGNALTRLLTPRLAQSLSNRSADEVPSSPPPPCCTCGLPRNPFPFRSNGDGVSLSPSKRAQPPVLPASNNEMSVFSLHSVDEEYDIGQPPSSRCPPAESLSPPPVPAGQPHPSEALDLPNAFATVESSNRSVRFPGSASSEVGDHQLH